MSPGQIPGWWCAGLRTRRCVLAKLGVAAMAPGKIPAWWHNLKIKPDPTILFEAAAWPDDVDPWPHLHNQELIHGRYRHVQGIQPLLAASPGTSSVASASPWLASS